LFPVPLSEALSGEPIGVRPPRTQGGAEEGYQE